LIGFFVAALTWSTVVSPLVVFAVAPTVTILAPSLGTTFAGLAGTINPNGLVTSWSFFLARPGEPYGAARCSGTLPAASSVRAVTCPVSGLTPYTFYYASLGATNADGYNHAETSFLTLAASTTAAGGAPIVTLGPATVSATDATLYGSINPNGHSTDYKFVWKQGTGFSEPLGADGTSACPGSLPAGTTAVTVTCTLTGLTPSTTYVYALMAVNTMGFEGDHSGPRTFTTLVQSTTASGAAHTDWAILSVGTNPASPQIGQSVYFTMSMTLLSTIDPLPQTVTIQCLIDGVSCGTGTVIHPGPVGQALSGSSNTPWIATPGPHILTWTISTVNDPNPTNNVSTTSFTVAFTTAQSSTTTTQTRSTTDTLTFQTTSSLQTSLTHEATSATSQQTVTVTADTIGELVNMIQQNSLLVIGGLGLLVVILAAVALRMSRKPPMTPSGSGVGQGQRVGARRCSHCGASNPSADSFCGKCGKEITPT
jgi:hypothetical protein